MRTVVTLAASLGLAIAACGGSSKPAAAPPTPEPPPHAAGGDADGDGGETDGGAWGEPYEGDPYGGDGYGGTPGDAGGGYTPPTFDPPLAAWDVECDAYFRAMDSFATCEQLPPETRQAMVETTAQAREQFDQSAKDATSEVQAAMAAGCRQGVDALRQAAAATGCPL